ncbi:MAG: nucleotide exchange factor GrpE [bacterium]
MNNDDKTIDPKDADMEELDEVVYDATIDSDNMSDPKEKIAKLKAKIKELTAQKDEYMNGWQRERADFVNFKKRAEEEKKDYIKFANENVLMEVLPVLESFDMAFMNKEQWNSVPQNWRVGVEYIHQQLVKILDENGLKEFVPKAGDIFDPKLHIAEEVIKADKKEDDGKIISVIKKGYKMSDRVIVAPKVTVGEWKE